MSWAEEQDWFGLDIEDLATEPIEKEEVVWETRDGDFLFISQMTSAHIQHCINMILKSNKKWRGGYLIHLQNELTKRTT